MTEPYQISNVRIFTSDGEETELSSALVFKVAPQDDGKVIARTVPSVTLSFKLSKEQVLDLLYPGHLMALHRRWLAGRFSGN